jgi:hypothetical protein
MGRIRRYTAQVTVIVSENSATRLARGFRAFPPLVHRCSSGRHEVGLNVLLRSPFQAIASLNSFLPRLADTGRNRKELT